MTERRWGELIVPGARWTTSRKHNAAATGDVMMEVRLAVVKKVCQLFLFGNVRDDWLGCWRPMNSYQHVQPSSVEIWTVIKWIVKTNPNLNPNTNPKPNTNPNPNLIF